MENKASEHSLEEKRWGHAYMQERAFQEEGTTNSKAKWD